jgi:hypothetical protein
MRFNRPILAVLALLLVASPLETSIAAPLGGAPETASHRIDARSICHHYRWSSKRHCTSANTLRFVARPPLYYPSKYFGGVPHYYYARPTYHWRTYPAYAHHRWYRWPYRYGWY